MAREDPYSDDKSMMEGDNMKRLVTAIAMLVATVSAVSANSMDDALNDLRDANNNFLAVGADAVKSAKKPLSKAKQLEMARNSVKSMLLDPYSAKFPNTWEAKHDGVYYLCGEVNAKNSYGAYVGRRMFVAVGISALIKRDDDPTFSTVFMQWCDTLGIGKKK